MLLQGYRRLLQRSGPGSLPGVGGARLQLWKVGGGSQVWLPVLVHHPSRRHLVL